MKSKVKGWLIDTALWLGGLSMLLPFGWMLTISLKSSDEVMMPFDWTSFHVEWSNYQVVWNNLPLIRYFANSLFIVVASTVIGIVITIWAAFAFSSMQFYGKNVLFAIILGTLMVPEELLLIPNYMTVAQLGWVDSYTALTIPWITNGFAVFYLVQSFSMIPREYIYAARVDGSRPFIYLWRVIVPFCKQPIITLILLKSIGNWNAYLWPLVVTNSKEMRTLPIGLLAFSTEIGTSYELLMAASMLTVLPMIVLYIILQKHILQGISQMGRLKS